jgi:hypothetical protein
MWGASMMDHEPPGRRRLSLHGCIYGVSSSEVPRSDPRATKHKNILFEPEPIAAPLKHNNST